MVITRPGCVSTVMLPNLCSIVTGNDLGIRIVATNESKAVFDRVRVHNNSNGIYFDDSARNGTISASVTDSVVAGNAGYGIRAVTTGPGQNGLRRACSISSST